MRGIGGAIEQQGERRKLRLASDAAGRRARERNMAKDVDDSAENESQAAEGAVLDMSQAPVKRMIAKAKARGGNRSVTRSTDTWLPVRKA